jgi:hypothetical protein
MTGFQQNNTVRELDVAPRSLQQQVESLDLDLRENPGVWFDVAIGWLSIDLLPKERDCFHQRSSGEQTHVRCSSGWHVDIPSADR